MASVYERTVNLSTGGQNLASRMSQIEELQPGDRVLYAGVGPGEDALAAAQRQARVTCLDLAPEMLEQAQRRFEAAGLTGEFICEDVMDYVPAEPFDVVTANFFLNLFSRPVMEQMLSRLAAMVRPGGKLLIADFAPAQGHFFQRVQHRLYHGSANRLHWMMGLCARHPIYVYADSYPQLGLELERTRRFRLPFPGFRPWVFQSTVARKAA